MEMKKKKKKKMKKKKKKKKFSHLFIDLVKSVAFISLIIFLLSCGSFFMDWMDSRIDGGLIGRKLGLHGSSTLRRVPGLTRGVDPSFYLPHPWIKGLFGYSPGSVYFLNYVNYVFPLFSFGFLVSETASILHQRNFVCKFLLHQLHHPPATSDRLILSGIHPRRVLRSPTRDFCQSGSGFFSLRRVLCLPTRGKDFDQRSATSRLGLFLWIAREVLNVDNGLCTGVFNHSFRRVDCTSIKRQRMSVPTRVDPVLTFFGYFQFSLSAPLHSLSKHWPNHTTTSFCVTERTLIQHACDGSSSEFLLFSFAGMFRAFVRLLPLLVGSPRVLGLFEKVTYPMFVRTLLC